MTTELSVKLAKLSIKVQILKDTILKLRRYNVNVTKKNNDLEVDRQYWENKAIALAFKVVDLQDKLDAKDNQ